MYFYIECHFPLGSKKIEEIASILGKVPGYAASILHQVATRQSQSGS
jgi:hypothetical protein